MDLSSGNTTLVVIVGAIAVFAVAIAMVFRRQVLAANDGTEEKKTIAVAVVEGASAYLNRQFADTGSVFAVVAFLLLFQAMVHGDLGNETALKIWRSVFFLIGAGFSAAIGYLGMWLATRANVRVAAAARRGTRPGDEGGVPHRRHRRNGHGRLGLLGACRRAAVRG